MGLFAFIYMVAVKELIVLTPSATSRIQSRVLGIDMLQAKKIERLSAIL